MALSDIITVLGNSIINLITSKVAKSLTTDTQSTLTTASKTIVGAINELNYEIGDIETLLAAV